MIERINGLPRVPIGTVAHPPHLVLAAGLQWAGGALFRVGGEGEGVA